MRTQRMRVAFILTILLVAANLAFLYGVTRKWKRDVEDLGEMERQRLEKIAAEKKEVEDLEARKKQLNAALNDVTYFFDRLVISEKDGYDRVRRTLQKLSEDTGTTINSINYTLEGESERRLQVLALTFQVTGSYEQIRGFLAGIETSPTLLIVDGIDLTSGGQAEDNVTLNLRLSTLLRKAAA
ncbi:MAG: type 4a pilus biogenesis protein PilO [Acidobacteriota bacterium]